MQNRVIYLVDGFNLYHSLKDVHSLLGTPTLWLDLKKLCESYLHLLGGGATVEKVYYFSALAHHRDLVDPGTTARHNDYIMALQNTGVTPELAEFKQKKVRCRNCGIVFDRYEEKETDVAIAVSLLELAISGQCETLVIVSGDTDLLPAIKKAKLLAPQIKIVACLPAMRHNDALKTEADLYFKIKPKQYNKFQFPNDIIMANGNIVSKPVKW